MIIESFSPDFFSRFDLSNKSLLTKIFATCCLVLLANLIKLSLHDYIGVGTPFLIYFGFVMICGRFIGFWYAIACLLVCGVTAAIYFIIPVEGYVFSAAIKLLIYFIEGFFISLVTNNVRKTLNLAKLANRNFKLLISNSRDGLARISKDGKLLYISTAVELLTGFTKEELQTQNFDIFPEDTDRKEVAEKFLHILTQPEKSVRIVHRYKNKQGAIKWMETILTNHLEVEGIHAVIANFRDVTDRIEAETRKNDFVGIAAHEIKNPMTVVKINAELLESSLEKNDPELAKKTVDAIRRNTKKVFQLLDEMQNFSGFEAALLHLNYSEFYLQAAIENSIATLKAGYPNEVIVEGNETISVKADRHRIEQVITNLLTNAAKYSIGTSPISIAYYTNNNELILTVTDKGMGIPEREIALLFTKFHRVKTTHNKAKGYGLGLYICAEIIKAHKGKIGVKSKEGTGSQFWISLPLDIQNP